VENSAAPENSLASLEFPAVLELLANHCRTAFGKDAALRLRPADSPVRARALQEATREMIILRQTSGTLPLALSSDVRPLLPRLEVAGGTLTAVEISLVLETMKAGQETRAYLARSAAGPLREWGRQFPDLGNLVRYLDGKISATGQLEDRCSQELLSIRRRVAGLSSRLEEALKSISSRPEVARSLQDDFVALRNNRHVLPVRIDSQGCVEGIVHALSSSGATVYVEPLSTVPLNNDLVRLKEEEEVEQRRILADFTELLRSRMPDLYALPEALGEADLLSAKAAFAEEMRGVDPDLTDSRGGSVGFNLQMEEARHPILERSLRRSGRPLVPLDLALEGEHKVLVISGPNTGGKTVALKTLGLLVLMAQSGLKVPAAAFRIPVFRRILIDIGDRQSIPDSLSTFSARMAAISAMAREVPEPSLVLLDEVGTGTDPEEGACLGAAIIEFFRLRGAAVLATTHLQSIKAYASSTPGVANASMDFDEATLQPLYRLQAGVPGRSGGLDIAQRLGVPPEIIRYARSLLPLQREMMEEYLRKLHSLHEELERKAHRMDELARDSDERERERQESARRLSLDRESRFSQFLEETSLRLRERWEDSLREVTDREAELRLRREFERRERQILDHARGELPPDLAPASRPRGPVPLRLKPGDPVRVASLGVEGKIERLEEERAVVISAGKRLTIPLSDLEEPSRRPTGPGLPPGVTLSRGTESAIPREIHLIGKRVEEALDLLDKYLDDACLASVSPVRVIHGMGTGRLRTAIRQFLESHPHVEGFSEADEREGRGGATVVRLRI
jgi:DNA mismatch repair protein MutS2